MDPDYVVVGSGLAGLSFAALAAKSGRRVLVLEAHDKPGGYAHTFDVGRHRFNAQLHYVWNCGEGRTVDDFLGKLGLREAIEFVELEPSGYDHMRIPGYALDVPGDFEELARRLAALFPAHAEGCSGFVEELARTDAELEAIPSSLGDVHRVFGSRGYLRLVKWRNATLKDVFEHHRLPIEAQALLALQWPDFLLPPGRLSFFAWVKLFAGYARGAFYPRKHFHHVVDSLVRIVRENGGEVLYGKRVAKFLLEGSRVVGVRYESLGASGEPTGVFEDVRATEVVSNMDPREAAELVGLERFAPRIREKLQYDYSPSSFVAYCAVEGLDLREHGFGRWNLFHSEDADLDRTFDAMFERADYSKISFAASTPTLVSDEPGACPPGQQLLELLTVADYRRFLHLKLDDPRAYREAKQAIFDAMIDVLEERYVPELRKHLSVHVLGSPTTNERFCRAPAGNSYGASMVPRLIWPGRLDHRTSIAGLHFCNATSGYAGFTGTIWTGCRLYEHLTGDSVHRGPHVREERPLPPYRRERVLR